MTYTWAHPSSFIVHPGRRKHRGLSLVELLISLTISAMLLTAVATSYTASANAIRSNDEFFRATQAARVSMAQILAAVRRSEETQVGTDAEHLAAEATITTAKPVASVENKPLLGVTLGNYPNFHNQTYSYDATNKKLILITEDDTTDPDYTLAHNIEGCDFTSDLQVLDGHTKVTRVTIAITVSVGTNTVRLSGSAVPRRTVKY